MTELFSQDRLIRARSFYRFCVCALAMTALCCTLLLHFSRVLTAQNLRNFLLFGVENIPETLEEITASDMPETESVKENESAVAEQELYDYTITELDMGCGDDYLTLRNNETDYNPDTSSLLESAYPESLKCEIKDKPIVLVIHTHATECYTPEGESGCNSDTAFRSTDTDENMIAVGEKFCEILEKDGIETVHCTVLHDAESYNEAYTNSLASVKEYLRKYPTIKYIFDIHRDAIFRESQAIKPICKIRGENVAQLMLVCGTNAKGADHPEWETNLSVCLKLQDKLCGKYPNLMRRIDLRGASFNQQYSPGFMLVEVGSCANTLEEAKRAVSLFAESVSEMIRENG